MAFRQPHGYPRKWPEPEPIKEEPKKVLPEWPFPWSKTTEAYVTDGPTEEITFIIDGLLFRVRPTGDTGVHTGRSRYRTMCLSCSETIHPNTTGPSWNIQAHLTLQHGYKWPIIPDVEKGTP